MLKVCLLGWRECGIWWLVLTVGDHRGIQEKPSPRERTDHRRYAPIRWTQWSASRRTQCLAGAPCRYVRDSPRVPQSARASPWSRHIRSSFGCQHPDTWPVDSFAPAEGCRGWRVRILHNPAPAFNDFPTNSCGRVPQYLCGSVCRDWSGRRTDVDNGKPSRSPHHHSAWQWGIATHRPCVSFS